MGWRTPSRFSAQFRRTGLRWDVAVEVWAARRALQRKTATVSDPTAEPTAYTRRLSLLDPGYRREALREIRRIVPRLRNAPFVNLYTGSDEPIALLPRGRARASAVRPPPRARLPPRDRLRAAGPGGPPQHLRPRAAALAGLVALLRRALPRDEAGAGAADPPARPRRAGEPQRLRVHRRLHALGLHPPGRVRRRRGGRSLRELPRARPGRAGALQPGLRRQAAVGPHRACGCASSSRASTTRATSPCPATSGPGAPRPCARAPPTSASSPRDNPRFTNRRLYQAMLDVARSLRGTRLPAPPTDPEQLVLYSTASEGQAQPDRAGNVRYRTDGDAIYTTYSLLGELSGGAFSFDADTRLAAEPARLAAAQDALAAARRHARRALRRAARRVGAGGRDAGRHGPRRLHPDPVRRLAGRGPRRADRGAPRPAAARQDPARWTRTRSAPGCRTTS